MPASPQSCFASIATAVTALEAHFAEQTSQMGETLGDTESKGVARSNLFRALEVINATARSIALKIPGLENKFRFPNSRSDQALLAVARAFAADAEPLKAEFIKRNMPASFIEDLQADIDAFADIISSRNVHAGSKVQATASIDDVLDEAMLNVRELDPAVVNAIGNDRLLLAEWRSARHIERAPRSSKPKPTPPVSPKTDPTGHNISNRDVRNKGKREAIPLGIASLTFGFIATLTGRLLNLQSR